MPNVLTEIELEASDME